MSTTSRPLSSSARAALIVGASPPSVSSGLPWRARRARTQRALHQYAFDPAPELPADAGHPSDFGEAEPDVQRDRRRVADVADHRNHQSVAAFTAGFDQAR